MSTIASDPVWLPHRYDPQHDAFHFRHTPRPADGAATFLTDDYLGEAKPTSIPRTAALAQADTPAPLAICPALRFLLFYAAGTVVRTGQGSGDEAELRVQRNGARDATVAAAGAGIAAVCTAAGVPGFGGAQSMDGRI